MDAAELEWIAWTTPITTSLGAALAASDFSGRTVACRQHVLADTICIFTPLVEAGARVRLAPCNPDSTDDRTVAHLGSIGVEVRAHAGMSAGELDESLAWLVSEPADALCDMGGDLTPPLLLPAPGRPERLRRRPPGCTDSTDWRSRSRCSTGTGSRSRT